MNIELQRHERDERMFVRQLDQLSGGDVWKRRYEESQRFLHAQLQREVENCKEISALRAALITANAKANKWEATLLRDAKHDSIRRGKMAKTTTKTKAVPLVVTTEHRGVFFGYGEPTSESEIRLERARMCVYWSADTKGVVGLAATGPSRTCKVGLAAPAMTIRKVTAVIECSPEAAEAWEKGPWA